MIPQADFLVDISSRYLTGNLLSSTQQEANAFKNFKWHSVNTNWEQAHRECESQFLSRICRSLNLK